MAPYPKLTSFPSMGQLTVIPPQQEEVSFTFLIEWSRARPDYPFELCLCFTRSRRAQHASTWNSVILEKSPNPYILETEDAFRSSFTATLSRDQLMSQDGDGSHPVQFTAKYRVDRFAPWQWALAQLGAPHGELLLPTGTGGNEKDDLFEIMDLKDGWHVTKGSSNSAEQASVYRLESKESIPEGEDGETLRVVELGKIKDQARFMAIVRLEPYWLGPRQGRDNFYLSEDAIMCSFLTNNGRFVTLVVLSTIEDTYTVIRSGANGTIVIAGQNNASRDVPFRVLVASASDFETATAAVMTEAREIVNNSPPIQDLADRVRSLIKVPHAQEDLIGTWLDGLAYCTWNGLGQDLTTEKIHTALRTLDENGITVSTLLIDDNWQTLGSTAHDFNDPFNRGWSRFEANEEGFPDGLAELLKKIKADYPAIKDIGVWHALMGYWGGLALEGNLTKTYETTDVETKLMGNRPSTIRSVAVSDIHRMYDDFYKFLADSGITFVKTDVQHMLSMFEKRQHRVDFVPAYQSAWTEAYLRYFDGKAISCMSQVPQTLFHSLLQTHTPRILLRNSDDFYPEIPASHPWHLWANAHNALFTQHLNVLPDWDMFQTSHEFSAYHGAARCVSGGPVLITDIPGEHDIDLIEQMTAPDTSGRTIALRPRVGKTPRAFDEYTDGNVLKVATKSDGGAGLLALFNVSEQEVRCMTTAADFPGFEGHRGEIVVRSHRTRQVFGPFRLDGVVKNSISKDLIYAVLPLRGFEVLTATPVQHHGATSNQLSVSVLGLLAKFSGSVAATSSSVTQSETGKTAVEVMLKALGTLGIWIGDGEISESDIQVFVQEQEIGKGYLKLGPQEGAGGERSQVLEIDVLEAWKGGLRSRDSGSHVNVKIVLSSRR